MLEADTGGNLLQLGDGDSAAIGSADQRAYTGAGDKLDGDIFFFENFEDADVGDAAGKTSAQR